MNSPAPWINDAILTWQKEGIKLRPGAMPFYLTELEQWMGFSFPPDFYEFYKTVNAFEKHESNSELFCLWSLETIWEEYSGRKDTEFIGFCDYMINSWQYGYRKNQPGIYRNAIGFKKVADSFKEFIELLNADSEVLY